jgi:GNAT superfamily N-acetyltransferase
MAGELHQRGIEGLKLEIELFGSSEPGRVLGLPGVIAAVSPLTPERSIFNSAYAVDDAALAESVDELAAAYDEADVRAWTVWVPDHERASAALLEQRGHVLDGSPRSMGLNLDDLRPPAKALPAGAELVEVDLGVAGRINDLAYGIEGPGWEMALGQDHDLRPHALGVSIEGEPVSCAISIEGEGEGDVCITGVATAPEHQGKGLAAALVARLLTDSRERGMKTGTLQASAAGAPVYERIGFSDVGFFELWEMRKPG